MSFRHIMSYVSPALVPQHCLLVGFALNIFIFGDAILFKCQYSLASFFSDDAFEWIAIDSMRHHVAKFYRNFKIKIIAYPHGIQWEVQQQQHISHHQAMKYR